MPIPATPNVRVGVGVFILASSKEGKSNPRFLVGKRIGSHGAGTCQLPGGHLEFGEEPSDCAIREVLEETGLHVNNVRFLTATNDYMPNDGKHYVTMFVVCERQDESVEPEVLEPEKCEGWEWMSWRELVALAEREMSAKEGEVVERRLFLPLLNLLRQRPGLLPTN